MVFVRSPIKTVQGFNLGLVLNKNSTKGKVGIEIEVEGANLPDPDTIPSPWVFHNDGSLRGKENAEYVLANPVEFEDVPAALETLWSRFDKSKSILDDSNRTSVHVHLNVQSFFFNRLTSLMALYFAFEEVLTEWCGDHRVGNLFCLRAKDAPAILSSIRRFIESDGRNMIHDGHHYAGLNANALHKFGSLEFRSLRGCSKPDVILDWVRILERLYVLSGEFEDPREICGIFSAEGPLAFFDSILGEMAPVVRRGIQMDEDQIRTSMYEGVRLAQDLCYCRDWSVFKGVEVRKDPFGRDARKVAKRLVRELAQGDAPSTGVDHWQAVPVQHATTPPSMFAHDQNPGMWDAVVTQELPGTGEY